MNRRYLHWSLTTILFGAASCLDGGRRTLTAPELTGNMPAGLVSDGAHSGAAGFYFLPPVVAQPALTGTFDPDIAALQPVVAICEITDAPIVACGALSAGATPALRVFTITSSPAVTLDGEKYKVDWDTGEQGFEAGRLYRIFVFAGQSRSELGFADAMISTVPGQVKNTDGETIVLRDGRTLPIHFRIEQGVVLGPGPATALQVRGPETSIAGATGSLTVTALDASGNVATGYAGTIAFTSTDPQAALPSNYTFTAADAGTHTFDAGIALRTAGSITVTATDEAQNIITGAHSVTVTPAATGKLALTGVPDQTTSGTVHDLAVTAQDEFGNTTTTYAGTVDFSSSDAAALLPSSYAFQPADAGVKTFAGGVTLKTAGAQTLRAEDAADDAIFGEKPVAVGSGNAATLRVEGLNDPSVAGSAGSITVTAHDANGNVVSDYFGTIVFTSTDPLATLPDNYAFVAADAGTHTFSASVIFRTAGSVTVTTTDQAASTITGAQAVTVTSAAATTLALSGIPTAATAGVAYDLTVTLRDEFGNTATGYAGTVQFTSSDPAASVPPAYTFLSSDAGSRTFAAGVIFKTAATQSFQATDAATPSLTLSFDVNVAHGPASQLRFTTQPGSVMEGAVIAPPVLVTAYDEFDNVASSFTGAVSMAIGTNPSGGALSGALQVNAVLGVATFADLRISAGGNGYTLVASGTGLANGTSDPFNIIATDVHWINASGGLWSNGANWSSGAPPTASQNAFIDLSGTYAVTLDVNATVSSIAVGAASGVQSLNANARTLTVMSSST
ncbi:MAG: hypothetical protein ACREOK_08490, partial [Gemmatimonadaceae bacterium]